MNKKNYFFWVLFVCLLGQMPIVFAQDIEAEAKKLKALKKKIQTLIKDPKSLVKGKGIKVTGGVTANNVFYKSNSPLALSRNPFNYVYAGNIQFDILGEIKMPLQFSYANNQTQFGPVVNPLRDIFNFKKPSLRQPFNRFVLKPSYKGLTLHTGTCALQFSPNTLAGHRYQGFGLEYKPKKDGFYGGLMKGRLLQAVPKDTTGLVEQVPAFRRDGMGMQLGIKKDKNLIGITVFTAQDQLGSLPYALDDRQISPLQNAVASVKAATLIAKKLFFEGELSVSGLTEDTRAQPLAETNALTRFGGLLQPNASTINKKAINSKVTWEQKAYKASLSYSRIDPRYRSLGGYYFLNDIETFATNLNTKLLKDKLNISADLGVQQDILEEQDLQQKRRLVTAVLLDYKASENLMLTFNYNSFASVSNLRSNFDYLTQITPYDALDTLNYRELNEQIAFNVQKKLGSEKNSKFIDLATAYQSGGVVGNKQRLLNISLQFGQDIKDKALQWQASWQGTYQQMLGQQQLQWGPMLGLTKGFADNKIKTNINALYALANSQTKTGGIANLRTQCAYAKGKHQLSLQGIYLYRQANEFLRLPAFGELTSTLTYNYKLSAAKLFK